MKRCVLGVVLVAMLVPTAALGQEFNPEEVERKMTEMELRGRDMELQGMHEKMEAERRLLDLEMKKREMEIEMGKRRMDLEMGKHKRELAHMDKGHKDGPHPLLLLVLVVNILVAVWVFQDIRQRNCGSGIWIAIALLTGLLGALVYAVVRVGDSNGNKKRA
jgi:hypothetical protein